MIRGSSTYKQTYALYISMFANKCHICAYVCNELIEGMEILVQFMLLYSFALYSE